MHSLRLKLDHKSIAWRRRKFERQAMLAECMRRAGTAYEEYFEKCSQNEKRDPTLASQKRRAERRVSVMSPQSLWMQDGFFWYRVAVTINGAQAAMTMAYMISCYGRGKVSC